MQEEQCKHKNLKSLLPFFAQVVLDTRGLDVTGAFCGSEALQFAVGSRGAGPTCSRFRVEG